MNMVKRPLHTRTDRQSNMQTDRQTKLSLDLLAAAKNENCSGKWYNSWFTDTTCFKIKQATYSNTPKMALLSNLNITQQISLVRLRIKLFYNYNNVGFPSLLDRKGLHDNSLWCARWQATGLDQRPIILWNATWANDGTYWDGNITNPKDAE